MHVARNNLGTSTCWERNGGPPSGKQLGREAPRVLFNKNPSMSQQCALGAKEPTDLLCCIRRSTARRSREVSLVLFSALCPDETHLECWVQFWAPQHRRDLGIYWSGYILKYMKFHLNIRLWSQKNKVIKQSLFCSVSGQTLELVDQTSCGFSPPKIFQPWLDTVLRNLL